MEPMKTRRRFKAMKNNNPRYGREALGSVAFFGLLFGIIYFLSINL